MLLVERNPAGLAAAKRQGESADENSG
jgi:hypothetical protein